MKLEDFLKRADEIIALGEKAAATKGRTEWGGTHVDAGMFSEFRASALSLLENLYGSSHSLSADFRERVQNAVSEHVDGGIGIIRAARGDMAGGWIATTTGIVSAEVFADFLEMGKHLLDEHYKDPAAVLAGGVLEEHLRQLCRREGITTEIQTANGTAPKRADAMNSELAKKGVYNKLDQKSVTSWLDLRNKAAHGQYAEYEEAQVDLMLSGVRDFVARNQL